MHKVVNAVTAWLMLAAILIVWSGATRADVLLREDAIEIHTNTVYWSGLRAGRLVVRQCPDCAPRSLSIDAATRYFARGLGEFDEPDALLDAMRDPGLRSGIAGIYLVHDTDRISRIVLSPAEQR